MGARSKGVAAPSVRHFQGREKAAPPTLALSAAEGLSGIGARPATFEEGAWTEVAVGWRDARCFRLFDR